MGAGELGNAQDPQGVTGEPSSLAWIGHRPRDFTIGEVDQVHNSKRDFLLWVGVG